LGETGTLRFTLDIAFDDISDASLTRLKGLWNLRHLGIACHRVTPKTMEELKAAFPDCEINSLDRSW
jgi:hypothetical protein